MKHPIPDAILASHIAIVGKTRSGKTSTAKLAIEQVVAGGARVCILDPIKSDWWGITSSADGRKPGLPFQILGGPRGHVPLTSSAGSAVAELVATGALPLSIVDMKRFEAGGLQRFFIDFASTLLDRMTGVVYLVLEEAHEFAPKDRAGIGEENMAVFWAKKLATAGGSEGLRLIVTTQRTQALHNAVLGSCETLIAHRLFLDADQKAVLGWLKNVNRKLADDVAPSLATLPTGTAWLCSAEAEIFEKVAFPRIATFDNTKTPTGEIASCPVKTAPIDVAKLRALVGEKVAEAEANDPVKLKARIAELEKAARKAGPAAADRPTADPAEISAAEQRGYDRGYESAAKMSALETRIFINRIRHSCEVFEERLNSGWFYRDEGSSEGHFPDPSTPTAVRASVGNKTEKTAKATAKYSEKYSETMRPERREGAPAAVAKPNGHDAPADGVTPALRRVLDALGWWRAAGQPMVPRSRACVVAGYSPKASTFGVYIGDLVKRGLVETGHGVIGLTEAGVAVATIPRMTSREEAREAGRALLKPAEVRVFDVIYDAFPNSIRRDAVAEAAGLSPTASTVGVYIGAVASFGLIEGAGRGEVKAAAWLFSS